MVSVDVKPNVSFLQLPMAPDPPTSPSLINLYGFCGVGSVVLTNFVVRFSMTPATRVTSHASKMAVHGPQRMFSAREVAELVLQPGSDEEEDVVGAFSDSDRELLDTDDDYIPVHDDEWSDVSEFFFTLSDTFLDYLSKKKKKCDEDQV